MDRRYFLTLFSGNILALTGCQFWPMRELLNPCYAPILPAPLAQHEIVTTALADLDGTQLWDGHVHLIGTGDSGSGIWVNPHMRSILHPVQYVQFKFYTNAACAVSAASVDKQFITRLIELNKVMPNGSRLLLLAFDYTYDENGQQRPDQSAFHIPNAYAARIAQQSPDHFGWIASIHPYRLDCVEALEQAVAQGARAIKWLPPGMGINPGSQLCDRFYTAMARLDLPLLTHGGEEKAIHGANTQDYGNPLLLRRALEHGVRVIVAHCASLGRYPDIDASTNGKYVDSFDLFARMMDEPRYEGLLYGEISALTQTNRIGKALDATLTRADWHPRLINASDYPLPGVMPLFSMQQLVKKGYINEKQADILSKVRKHNVLLFDLILKRCLQVKGSRYPIEVFHTRHIFEKNI